MTINLIRLNWQRLIWGCLSLHSLIKFAKSSDAEVMRESALHKRWEKSSNRTVTVNYSRKDNRDRVHYLSWERSLPLKRLRRVLLPSSNFIIYRQMTETTAKRMCLTQWNIHRSNQIWFANTARKKKKKSIKTRKMTTALPGTAKPITKDDAQVNGPNPSQCWTISNWLLSWVGLVFSLFDSWRKACRLIMRKRKATMTTTVAGAETGKRFFLRGKRRGEEDEEEETGGDEVFGNKTYGKQ